MRWLVIRGMAIYHTATVVSGNDVNMQHEASPEKLAKSLVVLHVAIADPGRLAAALIGSSHSFVCA